MVYCKTIGCTVDVREAPFVPPALQGDGMIAINVYRNTSWSTTLLMAEIR
jgi:hypothetical protein